MKEKKRGSRRIKTSKRGVSKLNSDGPIQDQVLKVRRTPILPGSGRGLSFCRSSGLMLQAISRAPRRKRKMIICDFCLQFQNDGQCSFGLRIPKRMSCRVFDPGIEKFCSDSSDFTGARQIIQMATYFGIKGKELKKIKLIGAQEEESRLESAVS